MTAGEMIALADRLRPNQYTTADKLRWLERLDGQVLSEVIGTHAEIAPDAAGGAAYTAATELLVPFPYGDDVYLNYLQAMVALENAETQRYNKRLQFFNNAYAEYQNWYNRNHSMSDVTDGGVRRHFVF